MVSDKSKIEIYPKYMPITQEPYCCVPACIQMILQRRKLPFYSQEEIALDLGFIIPPKLTERFPRAEVGEKPSSGYGTRVQFYPINGFFEKRKIKLIEEYYSLDRIDNVQEFLKENIKHDNDVIACFNYGKLYDGGGNWGHVSVVESLESNEHVLVELVDPEKNVPKNRTVELEKLIDAVKYHGIENKAGFWVIKSSKTKK